MCWRVRQFPSRRLTDALISGRAVAQVPADGVDCPRALHGISGNMSNREYPYYDTMQGLLIRATAALA